MQCYYNKWYDIVLYIAWEWVKGKKWCKINRHILNKTSHAVRNGKKEKTYLNNFRFKVEIKNDSYRLFRKYEK